MQDKRSVRCLVGHYANGVFVLPCSAVRQVVAASACEQTMGQGVFELERQTLSACTSWQEGYLVGIKPLRAEGELEVAFSIYSRLAPEVHVIQHGDLIVMSGMEAAWASHYFLFQGQPGIIPALCEMEDAVQLAIQ